MGWLLPFSGCIWNRTEISFALPSKLRWCLIEDDAAKPLGPFMQSRVSKAGRRHHYPELNMTVELLEDETRDLGSESKFDD